MKGALLTVRSVLVCGAFKSVVEKCALEFSVIKSVLMNVSESVLVAFCCRCVGQECVEMRR